MDVDLEITNALNDFDIFIKLLNRGEKSAAFSVLKRINLPLVGKYYREKFESESKEMTIFNCTSALRESLKIEDEFEKWKVSGRG